MLLWKQSQELGSFPKAPWSTFSKIIWIFHKKLPSCPSNAGSCLPIQGKLPSNSWKAQLKLNFLRQNYLLPSLRSGGWWRSLRARSDFQVPSGVFGVPMNKLVEAMLRWSSVFSVGAKQIAKIYGKWAESAVTSWKHGRPATERNPFRGKWLCRSGTAGKSFPRRRRSSCRDPVKHSQVPVSQGSAAGEAGTTPQINTAGDWFSRPSLTDRGKPLKAAPIGFRSNLPISSASSAFLFETTFFVGLLFSSNWSRLVVPSAGLRQLSKSLLGL